jgi:hypothetical protein
MRSRTAVSSPPSWRRFDFDALAIPLSLAILVPHSTTLRARVNRIFMLADVTVLSSRRLSVWYPVVPKKNPNFREESKEPNHE